jgi:hypothetical protein
MTLCREAGLLKDWRFWLGTLVSAGCLALSMRGVDFSGLGQVMAQARWAWLLPALALYLAGYWSRCSRVSQLMRPVKDVPARRIVAPLMVGFLFNNILPGRLGEFVLAWLLGRREGVSRTAAFAAVVLSRILDGFTILCFFLFGLLSFLPMGGGLEQGGAVLILGHSFARQEILGKVYLAAILSLLVFGAVLLGCFCLMVWKEWTLSMVERVLYLLPARISRASVKALERFIGGLDILRDPRALFGIFLFNFVPWGLEAFTYLFAGWCLGIDLNLRQVCLVMGMTNLAMILPAAPGGIGLFEFAGLQAMALFGFPSDRSLAFMLLVHLIILLPINALGAFFMLREGISFREALAGGRE